MLHRSHCIGALRRRMSAEGYSSRRLDRDLPDRVRQEGVTRPRNNRGECASARTLPVAGSSYCTMTEPRTAVLASVWTRIICVSSLDRKPRKFRLLPLPVVGVNATATLQSALTVMAPDDATW